ncbi:acyl-CoA desaturase [Moraxellaceae bacterium AER2_44_116]|nr:fatty acid desaturase [Moraxellaceae bacterium]TQC96603.1 acyl-CoA desaturase [Moraxellaceae bacterium AER2_44_116]
MSQTEDAPINWLPAFILIATPIAAITLIPWYALNHDFSTAAWVLMIGYLYANGLGITAGYHRLWAHRAYEAHWTVEVALMLFGGAAIQNSILNWASGHRTHHRFVDDVDKDPYSAKRGFWFSHMGWMLRNYPSSTPDYSNAPDLQKNKIVMFQHNHYLAIVLFMNIAVPVIFGFLVGDVWGTVLLMGLLRLVVSHHFTFFINSLAHMWGKQPYTDENTARDNFWLALLTYGEGYHNFHHIFQYDYRNGVKWWQFDPTKWLILSLSWLGLTKNLKRIPNFTIRKAELLMQFKRAQQQLEQKSSKLPSVDVEAMKQRFAKEYEAFVATMNDWGKLREEWYAEKKQTMMQKWEDAAFKTRFNEIDYRLKMQSKRVQLMMQQMMMPQVTAL